MPTWNSDALCKVSDVTDEIGDSLAAIPSSEGSSTVVITNAIKKAGEIITDLLLDFLPDIYAQSTLNMSWTIPYNEYLLLNSYTYQNLEDILDKVQNPEKLKLAAAAQSCVIIFRKFSTQNEFFITDRQIVMIEERKNWQKEFDLRFERGWRQLKLDLNQDGQISNSERPRTRNSFSRL